MLNTFCKVVFKIPVSTVSSFFFRLNTGINLTFNSDVFDILLYSVYWGVFVYLLNRHDRSSGELSSINWPSSAFFL